MDPSVVFTEREYNLLLKMKRTPMMDAWMEEWNADRNNPVLCMLLAGMLPNELKLLAEAVKESPSTGR